MKSTLTIGLLLFGTLVGHYVINLQAENAQYKLLSEISEKAKQIEADSVRDLIIANQQLSQEASADGNKQFIAGVLDVMNRPDRYSEVWHNGYDRGTEVHEYAMEIASQQNTASVENPNNVKPGSVD